MFDLWHAYGFQWKLLQMRELRHERVLLIGSRAMRCANRQYTRANLYVALLVRVC